MKIYYIFPDGYYKLSFYSENIGEFFNNPLYHEFRNYKSYLILESYDCFAKKGYNKRGGLKMQISFLIKTMNIFHRKDILCLETVEIDNFL